MKLTDTGLIDHLAQRYVTGTQIGAARRRFTRLAKARFDIRDRVDYWESRLAPLAWSLPAEAPSPMVWQRIRRELGLTGKSSDPHQNRALWPALAAASAVAALVMGGGWWQTASRPPETVTETIIERVPEAVSVAQISNDDGETLWLTRLLPGRGELTARVVTAPETKQQNDYQLWLLTADGTPLSLGLLPQSGERTLSVDAAVIAALDVDQKVAVSLEPAGGSPQPTPSGPVLYTALLLAP